MGRRSTPDRIYDARRAAVISRLVQADRVPADRAARLVAAWETEATQRWLDRGSAVFWEGAEQWILQLRRTR
jgi:hypothetical protein